MRISFLMENGLYPIAIHLFAPTDKDEIELRMFVCKLDGFVKFLE